MIAKPTNKTLPLAIILIILITFLGWLFDSGKKQGGKPKNQQNQPSEKPISKQ